jgi:hypothetical protein
MHRQFLALMVTLAVATLAISSTPVAAQQPGPATNAYKAPRTVDGQPDLQGVWANNAATPLERPKELEGRTTLTDAEVAALKARAAVLFNGDGDAAFGDDIFINALRDAKDFKSYDKQVGNYNHFWIVDRPIDNRTSLITDPADGKVPSYTAAAQKQVEAFLAKNKDVSEGVAGNNNSAEGPEDFGLGHRCISFGVPRLGAGYNSYYQIVQSRTTSPSIRRRSTTTASSRSTIALTCRTMCVSGWVTLAVTSKATPSSSKPRISTTSSVFATYPRRT